MGQLPDNFLASFGYHLYQ